MKLMFASDVHGDYDCAMATLAAYREEKAEKVHTEIYHKQKINVHRLSHIAPLFLLLI